MSGAVNSVILSSNEVCRTYSIAVRIKKGDETLDWEVRTFFLIGLSSRGFSGGRGGSDC